MTDPNVEFDGDLLAVEHDQSNCTLVFAPSVTGFHLETVHPTKAGQAIDIAALLSDFGAAQAAQWATAALDKRMRQMASDAAEARHFERMEARHA